MPSRAITRLAAVAAALCWQRCPSQQLPEHPSRAAWHRIGLALADYKSDLELTIEPSATELEPNQEVSLTLIVRNTGKRVVTACSGEGTVVHLWGLDERYAKILHLELVDHPFCQERFTLEPGGRFVHQVSVSIPAVPAGRAKFMASFMVLYPRDCDRYGCYDVRLSSSVPVHVKALAP